MLRLWGFLCISMSTDKSREHDILKYFRIIIFACTNGGCRQSDPLGPFATKGNNSVIPYSCC